MLRNGDLTGSKTLQEGRLSGSVGTNKTIATSKVQVDIRVGNQLPSMEGKRKGLDLDVTRQGLRCQNTSRSTITALLLGNIHGAHGWDQGRALVVVVVGEGGGVAAIGAGRCGCAGGLFGGVLGGFGGEALLLRGRKCGHGV